MYACMLPILVCAISVSFVNVFTYILIMECNFEKFQLIIFPGGIRVHVGHRQSGFQCEGYIDTSYSLSSLTCFLMSFYSQKVILCSPLFQF